MMRILQVLLRDAVGGAESLAASLQAEWTTRGHDCTTAYLDHDGTSSGRWARTRRMRTAIAASRADVVLAHGALPNLYSRVASARVPVVTVLHSAIDDFADRQLRTAERLLLRRTAAVVAVSDRLAEEYRGRFGARVPVTVIGNGVASAFAPTEQTGTGHRIVTLARVVPQKDPQTWLGIAERLVAVAPAARLEWFGPDGDPPWFAEAVARLPGAAQGAVAFVGPVSDTAAPLRDAALLLHTAVAEAQSITLIEAAATGVPIVCTTAVAETLPDGVSATSFPAGDADAGARAVHSALADLPALAASARRTSSSIRDRYGIARTADRYEEVIDAALDARDRDRRPR